MSKKKSLFCIVLCAAFVLYCIFLFACKKKENNSGHTCGNWTFYTAGDTVKDLQENTLRIDKVTIDKSVSFGNNIVTSEKGGFIIFSGVADIPNDFENYDVSLGGFISENESLSTSEETLVSDNFIIYGFDAVEFRRDLFRDYCVKDGAVKGNFSIVFETEFDIEKFDIEKVKAIAENTYGSYPKTGTAIEKYGWRIFEFSLTGFGLRGNWCCLMFPEDITVNF